MKIAIDGTAASGKGTLSTLLSNELKLPRLDTGLLYRKLAFIYIKSVKLINTQNTIDYSVLKTILNDFDLNNLDPETLKQDLYGNFASRIGKLDFVRNKLKIIQIEFVESMTKKNGGCILDGRDIGTKILPNADFKFYVDAPLEIRAKRRFNELIEKGQNVVLEDILESLKKRDESDMNRAISPLKIPNNAHIIDTSSLKPDAIVDKILNLYTITEN